MMTHSALGPCMEHVCCATQHTGQFTITVTRGMSGHGAQACRGLVSKHSLGNKSFKHSGASPESTLLILSHLLVSPLLGFLIPSFPNHWFFPLMNSPFTGFPPKLVFPLTLLPINLFSLLLVFPFTGLPLYWFSPLLVFPFLVFPYTGFLLCWFPLSGFSPLLVPLVSFNP